ncbi:unnamed protein product [Pleuronectes platessa]|uniref:MADF domain-containing protein n=1 Tax=Pleuronectes platessa TaxID=8262 RepID=A0A9N7V422_PLEPL|nr:unnamed protein product [Pleuronectes platessa]
MDQIEEHLAEEVRKYDHLNNPLLTEYKDTQMACNTWKDISANVGLQFDEGLWNKASRSTVALEIVNNVIAKKLLLPCTTSQCAGFNFDNQCQTSVPTQEDVCPRSP